MIMSNTMKKEVPSKEYVFEQLRGIKMTDPAKQIIMCMVENAWFDYCIIVKQITTALDIPKPVVEKSLEELIKIGLVKQQALFGTERTYVVNRAYFHSNRPPRLSRDELRSMLKVISN